MQRSTAGLLAGAFSGAVLVAASTVKIDAEYTGKIADIEIWMHTYTEPVPPFTRGEKLIKATYLGGLLVDEGKTRIKVPGLVSLDNGQESSFFLKWSANGYRAFPREDKYREGNIVHVNYSATFLEHARNYLQKQNILKFKEPVVLRANKLEVLSQ